jgi:hypothetical protein
MAVTNLFSAREEIVTRLKARLPSYEKNIIPLILEDEIFNKQQFTPAIFVAYLDSKTNQEAGRGQSVEKTVTHGVFLVYRDARGAIYTNDPAGQLMLEIEQHLTGFKPTGYSYPIVAKPSPMPYPLSNQKGESIGAICYPIIFESRFILTSI